MAVSKIAVLLAVLLAATAVHGRQLMANTSGYACQVTFFDDSFSGGSQTFDATVPANSNGCSQCNNLNLIRTNSWESFLASCGDTINLYDDRNCGGTTAALPARSGVIKGSLANSVDSFTLCQGVKY
ncbi:hypothetical protein WJX73_004621 [Symbiochloris irregularis]|uniref:Uncharacterized protein n=1 Tax=Symbiochloris irregularis TaxID=706552 RepID=A0AAW1P986_9CHLO